MKTIFSRFFSAHTPPPPVSTLVPRPPKDASAGVEEGPDTAVRRQLVQVLLRDVLRKHGIPSNWIECRMLGVNHTRKGTGLYVHLVLKHWDQRLIIHTLAFQNTLLLDISRFEPHASDWLHGISWQMEFEGQCPHTTLPGRDFWEMAALQSAPVAVPVASSVAAPHVTAESAPASAANAPSFAPFSEQGQPLTVRTLEEETQQDLEQLFQVRDAAMAQFTRPPVGYEATQPAHL